MEKLKFFQVRDSARSIQPIQAGRYRFGAFELDTGMHQLLCEGKAIRLQPKCFELLCLFITQRDHLLTKEHLMQTLWPDTFVEEANLANLIAALRKALGDSPTQSRFIQTVPKRGYRFSAEVTPSLPGKPVVVAPTGQFGPIRLIVFPFRGDDASGLNYAFADDISAALAELNTFIVRSVQLATDFDPVRWNPKDVAEKASVDFIISGSLNVTDKSIHILLQIIEAQTATIRISRSWNVARTEMAMLRQAVAQIIVKALARSQSAESSRPGALKDEEAYRSFLMANQLSRTRTPENMALARDLYVGCVEREPEFAPAWARLGRCYHFLKKFGSDASLDPQATRKAFDRAFSLDPDLVLAHALYTPIQADAGEARPAMLRLLRALEAHPNSPELLSALVHACRYCGQHETSIHAHNRVMDLDPHAHTSVAHTFFALGDYDRALFWYDTPAGLYLDVLTLASQGRTTESAALLSTRRHKFNSFPGPMYSLDAYLRDDRNSGLSALRQALANPAYEPESRFYMARQAAKFEDLDLAIAFLAEALSGGYCSSVTLERDQWFESVRQTKDFERIVSEMQKREEDARQAIAGVTVNGFQPGHGHRVEGPEKDEGDLD